uniref:Uncharacterized protein AlNc14C375G11156 n=1 Tax=Albugo laibachii Nc14 TaxID=890382 RepID=F0WY96_9STRA|nr:conserved hypothetical protein [Albugo laibachii Nc14]|eukprot:CCA26448.1 conserved hypothetical protein [Albugo laibachii Nc14]
MGAHEPAIYALRRVSSRVSKHGRERAQTSKRTTGYLLHRTEKSPSKNYSKTVSPQVQEQQKKIMRQIEQLKQLLVEKHPEKKTRFSISHLRHVGIPPVTIPEQLNNRRAIRTLVAGKKIPLTKQMWENQKKSARRLDVISEQFCYG